MQSPIEFGIVPLRELLEENLVLLELNQQTLIETRFEAGLDSLLPPEWALQVHYTVSIYFVKYNCNSGKKTKL